MRFQPLLSPTSLQTPAGAAATVRTRIIDYIRNSGHKPGERLAIERDLQEMLGVSRSRVRDALAALEADGIIARRIGSGTYLNCVIGRPGQTVPHLGDSADRVSPAALMEARMMLEVSMLPLRRRQRNK